MALKGVIGGGSSIGGTVTGGTAGSVLFIDPTNTLAQDNANLFWDDTNNRLGIGTNTPATPLHILTATPGIGVRSVNSATAGGGSGAGGVFQGQSVTDPTNEDWRLGVLEFGTSATMGAAGLYAYATEAWSGSAKGSYFTIETIGTGTTFRAQRLRIDNVGATFSANLTAAGSASFGAGGFTVNSAGTVTAGTWSGTTISLGKGGTGLPNTRTSIATSGTITAQAVASTFLVFTAGSVDLQGMVAQADGTEVTLYSSNSNITVYHGSGGATAANRFELPGSAFIVIPYNTGSTFRYYGTISRWVLVGGYGYASPSRDGILSTTQYNAFNAKVNGNYGAGGVAYWYNGTDITGDADFGFDATNVRLGVGVPLYDQEATIHARSDVAEAIATLGSASATLTQYNQLSTPASYGVTQQPGHLYQASSFGGYSYTNTGMTSYSSGDSIDYRLTAYNTDSGTKFSVVSATTNVMISSTGDDVALTWVDNGTGSASISGYYIERQVNGGGYNDYKDLGYVNNLNDDATGWTGSPSVSPTFPDFIANGSQRNYHAYSSGLDPEGNVIYSPGSIDQPFYDDASGYPYVLSHSISSGGSNARTLSDGFNTSVFDHYYDGTSFTEDTNTFTAGSTITPNNYGTQSNGSILTKQFDFYNHQTSPALYSASAVTSNTTDPSDSNYYYYVFTYSGETDDSKVINVTDNAGKTMSSGQVWDGQSALFSEGITVTPNSIYSPAFLAESHGSSTSDPAGMVSRSLDGTYSRFDFQDNTGARKGYFEQDASYLAMLGGGGGYLRLHNSANTMDGYATTSMQFESTSLTLNALSGGGGSLAYIGTNRITWNSTGIGFNNVTPVARATTGVAAATFTANTSANIAYKESTYDGYTTGQVVKALRNIGILT